MTADRPVSADVPTVAGPDLVLLLTSPRIAPGLLSRAAWQALERATSVLSADLGDPQPSALADAGVDVAAAEDVSPPALARALVETALSGPVVWVGSPDGDPGLTDALAVELSRVAAMTDPPSVEVLVGSHDLPGARLLDLVAVMDRLRSPGGCPWDAEQTPTSLVPYLVEEAFEAVEAIETGDRDAMREELGDVLLQVVFHARVAQEHPQDPFDIDAVADAIVTKLVRRHPHVFEGTDGLEGTDREAASADALQASWERIKEGERQAAQRGDFDGIPASLPALARADKVLARLERLGLPTDVPTGDGLTDQLLALVRQARRAGVDAETVLRRAVRQLELGGR